MLMHIYAEMQLEQWLTLTRSQMFFGGDLHHCSQRPLMSSACVCSDLCGATQELMGRNSNIRFKFQRVAP